MIFLLAVPAQEGVLLSGKGGNVSNMYAYKTWTIALVYLSRERPGIVVTLDQVNFNLTFSSTLFYELQWYKAEMLTFNSENIIITTKSIKH